MAVLSGTATIRFGVADTSDDMKDNTYGSAKEDGGVEVQAKAGDVFIIPAGVSHKTYDTLPAAEFALLTPGGGHGMPVPDPGATLGKIQLDGFTMIGAYPKGSAWDFMEGGENSGKYDEVWAVPRPERDPVMGDKGGLNDVWK